MKPSENDAPRSTLGRAKPAASMGAVTQSSVVTPSPLLERATSRGRSMARLSLRAVS